ncbi:alpha-amylase family glycosyl hydrolase [uncultured Rikenella sp.]|uniref:alpha-amylase family glycosyl hydrolase n=1 Tax=uncultured Rikenella sp. TaxID=368003 RepID=UPI002609F970|nr:alpha-amylase family glycosyl hydrolase [uncultured Rikenella sp.]
MGELLYRCRPQACKRHPEWAYDAVIYELNVRQFSPEGTFAAVRAQLPRLRALGVDILWLMPIYPIGVERRKGTLGSYYAVRDYCGVNPEFGTFDEFRQLVEAVHGLGMRVILDWVPNHTSRDAVWVEAHPEWYKRDPETGEIATPYDWTDTAQLDYDNPAMRRGMVEAMLFWLRETAIDGFRVDMAMLEPIGFWDACVPELAAFMEARSRGLFMLAEAEGPEFHRVAFDATYSWEVHHLMVDVAQNKVSAPAAVLRERLLREGEAYPMDALRMRFTSNHDENSWNGSEFVRFGAAVRQMAALTYLLPGMPLIYNGQEAGSDRKLAFFDKDRIDWSGLGNNGWEAFYRELNGLRHSHVALRGGLCGGDVYAMDNSLSDKVFAIKRRVGDSVVMGLFNLSPDHADFELYDEDFNGSFRQIGSPELALLRSHVHFYLPPWGFFVYFK